MRMGCAAAAAAAGPAFVSQQLALVLQPAPWAALGRNRASTVTLDRNHSSSEATSLLSRYLGGGGRGGGDGEAKAEGGAGWPGRCRGRRGYLGGCGGGRTAGGGGAPAARPWWDAHAAKDADVSSQRAMELRRVRRTSHGLRRFSREAPFYARQDERQEEARGKGV